MGPILTGLVVLEALLTVMAIAMFVWRGLVDMKEEDQLILFSSEKHIAQEQAAVRSRATVIDRLLKKLGVAWGILFVAICGHVILFYV